MRNSKVSGQVKFRRAAVALATAPLLLAGMVVVGAATASATAPPGPVNLIAADATTIAWQQDFVGATNPPSGYSTWPSYVYNNSRYSSVALGQVYTALQVNGNSSSSPPLECTSSWKWVQILCDQQAPGSPTLGSKDSLDSVYKANLDAGFTINSVSATEAYVVIDLGSTQAFNTLRVFQMFSDGKVTRASIFTNSETGSTRPAFNDPRWSLAKEAPIGAGLQVTEGANEFVKCPTVMSLGAKTSRYVKLVFMNSGEFGSPTWVEVGAAKLFNETAPYVPDAGCPPEPPVSPAATAGDAQATLTWTPGSGTATGWAIEQSVDGGTNWTTSTTSPSILPASPASATITGLTNGTSYVLRVRALNGTNGDSPFTPQSNSVTPSAYVPPAPAPSGGGGGTPASEPTPTPTPTPTPVTLPAARPPLEPIANQQNQSVPSSGLPAGSSLLLVNGVPTSVVVAPNASSSPTGLVVTGDGFTMRLAGLNAQGQPLGLSPNDGALVLGQDRMAQVEGTGYLPNSDVRLYMFSEPRYIGTVATDASGNFVGEVPIPKDVPVGRHTLQANGYAKDGDVRSLSLGVMVRPDLAPRVRAAQATVTFAPMSSVLSNEAKARLRTLLKGRKDTAVRTLAVGFVQPTIGTMNDQSLSLARAESVKSYLRELGLKGPVTARGDGVSSEPGAAGRKVSVSIRYTM